MWFCVSDYPSQCPDSLDVFSDPADHARGLTSGVHRRTVNGGLNLEPIRFGRRECYDVDLPSQRRPMVGESCRNTFSSPAPEGMNKQENLHRDGAFASNSRLA